jgi:hypothetical protein
VLWFKIMFNFRILKVLKKKKLIFFSWF